jgi:hypothetical protein
MLKTQKRVILATGNNSKGKATDFSNGPQEFTMINTPDANYSEFRNKINDADVRKNLESKNLYEITLKNKGGLVTPIIIEWTFKDGTKEIEQLPAEIWRLNETEVKKIFVKEKEVTRVVIDPTGETGEVNPADNVFPKRVTENKFDSFKKN